MLKAIVFIFVLLFSSQVNSQQIIDKQIQIGLDKIYNFNWNAGFEAFNNVINKYPDDPRGYHYKSTIYLWFFLGNLNEVNLDSFNYYSDKSLELAELKRKKNPSAEIKLLNWIYILQQVYCRS